MTRDEINHYCAIRIPGACPVCSADPSTGNGWFCARHYAEVEQVSIDEYNARQEQLKLRRSAAAKGAADTRKLDNGTVYRNGKRVETKPKNMRKYAEIKARFTGLR